MAAAIGGIGRLFRKQGSRPETPNIRAVLPAPLTTLSLRNLPLANKSAGAGGKGSWENKILQYG
jgi:hypothetical protein